MQISHEVIITGSFIYEQLKFWGTVVTFGWGIYRAWAWVKGIREQDLHELKGSVASLETAVKDTNEQLKSQTVSIVDQLKELRSDFRTFYTIPTPQMVPARAKAVKSPPTKTKQRSKKKS